jgi:protein-S-isoprenylcysteine O-methyltransferase Ste14
MAHATRLPRLGARGEGWVVIQFALLAAIALSPLVGLIWSGGWRTVGYAAGGALLTAGMALIVAGAVALGHAVTPLPKPREGAELVAHGLYRHARHPIYGGVVLLGLGWALVFASVLGIALSAVLLLFFELKARREEEWLVGHYPGYDAYRRRTRRKFLPWVY